MDAPPNFQALFDRCCNWGRWGPDDERGTLNLIGPEQRIRAAQLVTSGLSVSCALPVNSTGDAENTAPAVHAMLRGGDVADGTTVRFLSDYLAVAPHGVAHSHLDALCHFFWNGRMYNNRPVTLVTTLGARANAVTIGQDGIFSRGVLLDIPRVLHVDWLETDHAITISQLQQAEQEAGIRVESGDILLVRTGRHARRRSVGAWDPRTALAGLHHEVAPWLKERGVALLGCDGVTDVRKHPFTETPHPMHILTLVAMGMQLLDNLDLDALADTCAQQQRWQFQFIVAPLKLPGGTASMVNPIAVF